MIAIWDWLQRSKDSDYLMEVTTVHQEDNNDVEWKKG